MIFCVKHQFPTFLNSLKYRIRGYFASSSEHRGMDQTKRTTQSRIAVSSRGSVASSAAKSAARSTPPSAREKCHLPLRTRRHYQRAATSAQRSPAWPHAASIAIALLRAWGTFIRLFCVPLHALTRLQLFAYSTSRLTCVFARKRTSRASLRMSAPDTIVSCNKLLSQETLFLRRANHANGCAAIGTLPLRNRLTVFRNALNRVNHDFLRLALNAISFFCCHRRQPFWSGARERKHYWNGDDSP